MNMHMTPEPTSEDQSPCMPKVTLLEIDPRLKEIAPSLRLGVVTADVTVGEKNEELWKKLNEAGRNAADQYSEEGSLSKAGPIAAAKAAYKACGKDPSRYRLSSEALIRRVLNDKGLYQVNTVIDVNNLISIESRHSIGTYDLDKLSGPMVFRIGNDGESYQGIGKGDINLAGLPLFSDSSGPFGTPTSDSQRSMVTLETKRIMFIIIAFDGEPSLDRFMEQSSLNLAQYANATNIESMIVE